MLQYLPSILQVLGWAVVIGFLWMIARELGAVTKAVDLLANNHMKHFQEDLSALREMFIQHLDKGDKD